MIVDANHAAGQKTKPIQLSLREKRGGLLLVFSVCFLMMDLKNILCLMLIDKKACMLNNIECNLSNSQRQRLIIPMTRLAVRIVTMVPMRRDGWSRSIFVILTGRLETVMTAMTVMTATIQIPTHIAGQHRTIF